MNRSFFAFVILCFLFYTQIEGQTTRTTITETTTSPSEKRTGKTETVTRIITILPNGDSVITITRTSIAKLKSSLGIKANVGPSNFVLRNMPDYRSNMGFSLLTGGFLKLESRTFALQYELLIRYRSSEQEDTVGNTKTNYQYWGLELPVYIMGQIPTKAGKVFIGAGAYVSFGFDAKQTPKNVNLYRKNNATGKAVMQRWDFGLGTMLGFEFKNGISLNVGCYQGGLINALSEEKQDKSMKNQTVNFGIGYKF